MDRPHCVYPVTCGWTLGLFPPFGCCEWYCYEHGVCKCLSEILLTIILGIYIFATLCTKKLPQTLGFQAFYFPAQMLGWRSRLAKELRHVFQQRRTWGGEERRRRCICWHYPHMPSQLILTATQIWATDAFAYQGCFF